MSSGSPTSTYWRGVVVDARCLDVRLNHGHSAACSRCGARGCCSHCLDDRLLPVAPQPAPNSEEGH